MIKYFSSSRNRYFRYDPEGIKTVEAYVPEIGKWLSTHYVDEEDLIRCFGTFGGIITTITEEETLTYLTMKELTS